MSWTEEKDILLMREMAAQGIFQFKTGSKAKEAIYGKQLPAISMAIKISLVMSAREVVETDLP